MAGETSVVVKHVWAAACLVMAALLLVAAQLAVLFGSPWTVPFGWAILGVVAAATFLGIMGAAPVRAALPTVDWDFEGVEP